MAKVNLTKKWLDSQPPKPRRTVHDAKQAGLVVIIGAKSKVFYRYAWTAGKPVFTKIGPYPDIPIDEARRRCRELTGRAAKGEDLAGGGRLTFAQLWEHYLEQHAKPRKKTWQGDQYNYDRHLADLFGNRKVASLKRADLRVWHNDLGKQIGKTTANRVLSLLRKILQHGVDNELCEENAAAGIKKFPEKSRERFANPDELRRLFESLAVEPNQDFADYVRLSLLTGQRQSNVLEMTWDQIDSQAAVWSIPETKSGKAHRVPLCGPAVELLQARQERAKHATLVFPSKDGSRHMWVPRRAWLRLLERAKITDLTMHDLRRTLASWQAAAGVSELIIGKTLGHSAGSKATSVYARLDLDPVRDAVEVATAAMLEATQGGQADG